MTISMALTDFIPVILFCISSILIQRKLYNEMSKGAFALLAGGTIMVMSAGFMKALWKLLFAAGICDFERLSDCFFPMQSIGFLLAGISIIALLFFRQEERKALHSAAPVFFSGTAIFVIMMVLGCLGYCGSLSLYALRHQKRKAAVLFLAAFFLMLMMGYLSSRDFTLASMNWIAEGVNAAAQLSLFLGSLSLIR